MNKDLISGQFKQNADFNAFIDEIYHLQSIQVLDLTKCYYNIYHTLYMTALKTVFLLMAFLAISTINQNCVGSQSDDLIQTGIIQIYNPLSSNSAFAQTPINYVIPSTGFSVGLSLAQFGYVFTNGVDFTLLGGRIGTSNNLGINLILNQDNRWTQVKISYFVSSRSDLWIGAFTADLFDISQNLGVSGLQSTSAQGYVNNWPANGGSYSYLQAVMVSGLRTSSSLSSFSIVLSSVNLNQATGLLQINIAQASIGIYQVKITYLVFINPHPRFTFSSFNYPGNVPTSSNYNFVGVSSFGNGSAINSLPGFYGIGIQSNLLNCFGNGCQTNCTTQINCTSNGGVINGTNCIICINGSTFNASSGNCTTATTVCGLNQQSVNGVCQCKFGFIQLGTVCVYRCGINQGWNGNSCQCIAGYSKINGVCRQCPTGSQPDTNQTTCLCNSRSVFDINTFTCVSTGQCPPNSSPVVQNGISQCKCNTNYQSNGVACIYCPSPASWNSTSLVCYCSDSTQYFNGAQCVSCGTNKFFNSTSQKCQCVSPMILNSATGQCVCPSNLPYNNATNLCGCTGAFQILNGSVCVCKTPYIRLNSGECGLVCGQNEWWLGGACVCKAPFTVRVNGVCTYPCEANQTYNGIQCVCSTGFFNISGVCTTCPSGQTYNTTTKSCQNNCAPNAIWNGTTCQCIQNYYLINGACTQCPSGTHYNSSLGICQTCGQNQVWNGTLCICINNFYRINGICVTCPAGTTFNSTSQTCQPICTGINQVYNSSSCVCALNYYRINGNCGQCPTETTYNQTSQSCICLGANRVFNGTHCVCAQGYYIISGNCGQCPTGTTYNPTSQTCAAICTGQNQIFNSGSCVCVQNFYRINGVCGQCPLGTSYNNSTQSCPSVCTGVNEVYSSGSCICTQNYYRINGICGQCPTGTTYNQNSQSCICLGANQVFNGTHCVCLQNYYVINGACGQCPSGTSYNSNSQTCTTQCNSNQTYNGTACVCASNYYLINGSCQLCPANTVWNSTTSTCVSVSTCPPRSTWNSSTLQCVCNVNGQHLINGSCQTCGAHQGWNGQKCVCVTGYYLIAGICQTCDINSSYNQTLKDCICNNGFYGNRTLCQKCDPSCGTCTGNGSSQCLTCVDVSYTFSNGVCTKQTPCVAGYFQSSPSANCTACSPYCTDCINLNTCYKCAVGFTLGSVSLGPQTYYYCQQICGDGKRFQLPCDDNNTVNGDGCSSNCSVESGWSCSGGTSTSKSNCAPFLPSKSIITAKGSVQLVGKVVQGITVSYLPNNLTTGGCPNCSQLLLVRVTQADVIPSFQVSYLPTSQYKFLIEFDFQGIFGIPVFTVTIQLNPAFSSYFTTGDMAQLVTLTIDPAVLAIGDTPSELTFDQIVNNQIVVSNNDLTKIFS